MKELVNHVKGLERPDYLIDFQPGKAAYENVIRPMLSRIPEGEVFVLSFKDVKLVDSSFAGGSIFMLAAELVAGELGERFIFLDNANATIRFNIDATIRSRTEQKDLALQARDAGKKVHILGKLSDTLNNVLVLVNERLEMTARELADKESVELNTASNWLQKLFKLRLVRRADSTGRKYVYQSLMMADY